MRQEGLGICVPVANLAAMIRQVRTQSMTAVKLAARQQAEAAQLIRTMAMIRLAMNDTEPGTWVAMVDARRQMTDDDQASPGAHTRRLFLSGKS